MTESLPGCIGYFGAPIGPNNCAICKVRKVCKNVVAKTRLQPFVERLEKVEKIIRKG